MDWKTHLVFGLALGAIAAYFIYPEEAILFAAISAFCALLPDLDLQKSKASQMLLFAIVCLVLASAWALSGGEFALFILYSLALFGVAALLDILIRPRHRGITHTVAFALAASVLIFLAAGAFFAAAFFCGYFSHLLSDGHLRFF